MPTEEIKDLKNYTYEFRLKLFSTEVFCVGFSSTSDSGRWIALSIGSVSFALIALALYGTKLLGVFA